IRHRQRTGRAPPFARQDISPAGHRPRQRDRPWPQPCAGFRRAARRHRGVRFTGGPHRIPHDPAFGAMMKPVWIVDDDQSIRWVLEKALARVSIPAQSFSSAAEALEALEHGLPSVLLTDVRMPGQDGLSLLHRIKQDHPGLPVIIMTAFTDLNSTVAAFQKGAFDYLPKPFDVNAAVALVQRAGQAGPREPAGEEAAAEPAGAGRIMLQSSSPAMQEVFRAIGRLAASSVTVLITGES